MKGPIYIKNNMYFINNNITVRECFKECLRDLRQDL